MRYCTSRRQRCTRIQPISHTTRQILLSNAALIKQIGLELGFQQVGITDTRLDSQHANYRLWLDRHYHGEMGYMARNLDKRLNPAELVPDTLSVICVRLDYLVEETESPMSLLDHDSLAYVSRYSLGRDYHKLMRKRLAQLATQLRAAVTEAMG